MIFEYNIVDTMSAEALYSIEPQEKSGGSSIIFLKNTISNPSRHSLVINENYQSIYRTVSGNEFSINCECNISVVFEELLNRDEVKQTDPIMINSYCRNFENDEYQKISDYFDNECRPLPIAIIVSMSVGVVLIMIIVIMAIVCNRRVKQVKESSCRFSDCTSQSFSTLRSNPPPPMTPVYDDFGSMWSSPEPQHHQWIVAVPEVKTYQEAEINFKFENAEPMTPPIRVSQQHPLVQYHQKSQARISCPPMVI